MVTDGTPKASGFGSWGNIDKFCAVVVFCHSQDISTKTMFVNVKVCSGGGGLGVRFNGPSRICCAVAGIVKKYNEISGIVCKKRLKKLPNPKGPLF